MSVKRFFTCGQIHSHKIKKGVVWNKNNCIEVEAPTEKDAVDLVYKLFGPQWSSVYDTFEEIKDFLPGGICFKYFWVNVEKQTKI